MLQERHDRETLRSVIFDSFDRSWGFNRDVRFVSNLPPCRKMQRWWWFINLWSLCDSLGRSIYSSTTVGYWWLSSWAAHLVRSDTACYADCRVWFSVDGKRNVKVVIGAKAGVLPRDCTDVSSRHDNKTHWSVATDISHTQNRTKNYTRIRVYKVILSTTDPFFSSHQLRSLPPDLANRSQGAPQHSLSYQFKLGLLQLRKRKRDGRVCDTQLCCSFFEYRTVSFLWCYWIGDTRRWCGVVDLWILGPLRGCSSIDIESANQ